MSCGGGRLEGDGSPPSRFLAAAVTGEIAICYQVILSAHDRVALARDSSATLISTQIAMMDALAGSVRVALHYRRHLRNLATAAAASGPGSTSSSSTESKEGQQTDVVVKYRHRSYSNHILRQEKKIRSHIACDDALSTIVMNLNDGIQF